MTNEELKEFIQLNMTSLKAQIISNKDVQDIYHNTEMTKMEEIITHQKQTNGRVLKSECKISELKEDTALVSYAKKHPIQIVGAFLLAVVACSWVGDHIDIKTIIDLLK